jgi:DNA-binding IscR family transcriptional regulator
MRNVWVAVRAALRDVLDHVTVADVARGELPQVVRELTSRPGAWESPATISHQSG